MKALLRKEYYIIGGHKYLLILFIAPLALHLWANYLYHDEAEFFYPMAAFIIGFPIGLLPTSTDRLEAQSRWRTYAKALPYSRAEKVFAKFLFSLLAAMVGTAVCAVSMLLQHCSAFRVTTNAAITLVTALNTSAFLYPLIFRRIRRGGSFLFYLIATLLGIVYFLPQFSLLVAFSTASTMRSGIAPLTAPPQLLLYAPYIALPVSVMIYLLSWMLTYKIYGCKFAAAPKKPHNNKDSDDGFIILQTMFWN